MSGNDNHCSYPRLTSWRLRETVMGGGGGFICLFICLFLCHFLGAHHILLGQAWAGDKGELSTCRHCADSGLETDCT